MQDSKAQIRDIPGMVATLDYFPSCVGLVRYNVASPGHCDFRASCSHMSATLPSSIVWYRSGLVWVEFNGPPDTIEVISEAVFTANHLTDTDKQNSTGKYKLNTNQKKVNNLKYSKTKLPWFSCLLQHSARKRGGLILQRAWAHTGRRTSKNAVQNVMMSSKTDRPDRAKTFPHQL